MKKLLLLLVLVACNRDEARKLVSPTVEDKVVELTYVKDTRTKLCFAVSWVSEYPIGTAYVYSSVPCTPEVERLIKPATP
jgi:hypothetical protein